MAKSGRTQEEAISEDSQALVALNERRARVVELRTAGKTYEYISQQVEVSDEQCRRDFKYAMSHRIATNVDEYRLLELDRLEWALDKAREMVTDDDLDAKVQLTALGKYLDAERGIRILVGADAPLRQEIAVLTDDLLEQKKAELLEEVKRRRALLENSIETTAVTVGGSSPAIS